MRPRTVVAVAAASLFALGVPGAITSAQAQGTAPAVEEGGTQAKNLESAAGASITMGRWRIHHIPELRLGQPTMDPQTGAIYHPVAITGTSISFYVIGAGEQELWEVPVIWAGDQPTGNRFHKLDYFGILEETGGLYIYSRETE
ncbi:hypothetical protein [Rhodospira trueperi]|uniref:Uncharacterized protein n=1 Tax=Rhodospira trueperi TaxID=69960 RepID=A0A1G7ARF4_9PROT|nr:hypothetical protein [Rhodospira trueperi]SDE17371.1 hypothetical protein SAMN05421720_10458 [Rhodospira trueperi]